MASRPRTRPGVVPVRSTDKRPRVRLTGPGGLAAVLPQLIGFPPVESLVLVGLVPGRSGRLEIGLTIRVDLGDVDDALEAALRAVDDEPADLLDDDDDELDLMSRMRARPLPPCHPASLVAAMQRNGCVAVLVVVVSEQADPPTAAEPGDLGIYVVAVLEATCAQASLDVVDALLVRDDRWWSYLCSRPTCCPAEGTPVSRADSDLFTAELAWAGAPSVVLPDRDALVAKVLPASGPLAQAVEGVIEGSSHAGLASGTRADALGSVSDLITRLETDEAGIDAAAWARLLVDLTDIGVRDGCLMPWKGSVGERALALWCRATQLAPRGFVAAPATLAALTAHARGDGALAGEAVSRALVDDPDYRLARYAGQALTGGISPRDIRRMLVEGTAVLRARGEPVLDASGRVVQRTAPC